MTDPRGVPLVVDVDGTLLTTDLLLEGVRRMARTRPGGLVPAVAALARGRAALKSYVADRSNIDPEGLELNPDVVALMRRVREAGRPVGLASGADRRQVDALAERIEADFAFANDGSTNLTGERKLERVRRTYPLFDYVGDAWADLPLLLEARRAYLASPAPFLAWWCRRLGRDVAVLGQADGSPGPRPTTRRGTGPGSRRDRGPE